MNCVPLARCPTKPFAMHFLFQSSSIYYILRDQPHALDKDQGTKNLAPALRAPTLEWKKQSNKEKLYIGVTQTGF